MSNVKTYRVSADRLDDVEVTLQVDHDTLTPELATHINTFWGWAAGRVREEGGDVVRAVIRLFGCAAINCFLADGGASFGPSSDDRSWTERVIEHQGEGWPDVGELGILIVAAEVSMVDYGDVTLDESEA